MSGIAKVVDNVGDFKFFKVGTLLQKVVSQNAHLACQNISETYISKWERFGISRDGTYAKLAYHWYGSWTTIYNLYADALLCFHLEGTSQVASTLDRAGHYSQQKPLDPASHATPTRNHTGFVPPHIYKMQSDWYRNVLQRYGLPLDSRHLYTKSDWEFFAAAVTSKAVRTEILQATAKWVNETSTDRPMTDLHDTEGDGGFLGAYFMARPVIGGHFAFLTLGRACGGGAMKGLAYLEDGAEQTNQLAKTDRKAS